MKRTIRSSAEITRIFQNGSKCSQKYLMLISEKSDRQRDPRGRVAYIAGKRLGKAPLRSRAKRLMREAVQAEGGPWEGWDLLLIARSPIVSVRAGEVREALQNLLAKAQIGTKCAQNVDVGQ